MFRLTRIPVEGDSIVEHGFRFSVESMSGRRVNTVKVEAVDPNGGEHPEDDEGR